MTELARLREWVNLSVRVCLSVFSDYIYLSIYLTNPYFMMQLSTPSPYLFSIYDDIPMDCLVAEQEETDATLEIPSGISSHEEICIKGKGMKKLDPIGKGGEEDCGGEEGGGAGAGAGGFGDHKVQIIIASPSSITERQRTLMERYAELEMGRDGTVNVRGGSLGQRSEPEDEDRGETEEVDQRDGQKLRNDGHDGHETEQKKGRLMN